DFGLARRLDAAPDSRPTPTGALLGTPGYMAPEQAECRTDQIGPPADVWGLGAVLYECLTGRPPFQDIRQTIRDEPPRPSTLRPDAPPDLEAVVLKCLEKAPADRYADAAALADDLAAFLAGRSLSVQPLSEWERQQRWARAAGFELIELSGCT